jgi:pimeloyl-ACP methyl ester carboxylesterase
MRTFSLLALSLAAIACGREIPQVTRPAVITALYDPARGELPTPNDLALDASGKVSITPNVLLTDAENALKATMNGRDGFSSASGARVQFNGLLASGSVGASGILVFDLGLKGAGPATEVQVERVWADCDRSVTVSARAGFSPGHTYLFAVRGGASGVRGASGEEVVASPAFYFLRAGKDLTQHVDAMPGKTRAEKRDTAARLEAVRQKLEPHFKTLELAGVPRQEIAAAWTFTVHTQGEALQDPASKRIPFPNDLLRDVNTGLVSLPADVNDSPTQKELKANFNTLDGFSTTAALSLESTAPVDPATVNATTLRLFEADGREVPLTRTVQPGGKKIVLQPSETLAPATRHVVLAFGIKDVNGKLIEAMPLSSVFSLAFPLVDDQGASRLSNFCDATAQRLEPIRASVAAVLAKTSLPSAEVRAAWAFTTIDLQKRARELWLTPYQSALPLEVVDGKLDPPSLGMPSVSKVLSGKLWTYDRLDGLKGFRTDGKGVARKIEFILALPKGVPAGGKVSVVIFGHGLYTERRLMLLVSERLARAGFASMAIDFPMHGERSACNTDLHCELGAACVEGKCMTSSGAPKDFARVVKIPGLPGPGTPTSTGATFVDTESLTATRDHFRQALIDLSAQMRLIRNFDWTQATGGIGLDGDQVHWVGISLGGILGASVSGVDPYLNRQLLNVPGAGLPQVMTESLTFQGQLSQSLAQKGITKGTPEYDQFLNAAKWTLDEIDPINLAAFARRRPLVYQDPFTGELKTAAKKQLRVQMATGDTVVPNVTTEALLIAAGLDRDTEFRAFLGTHMFLGDPAEPIAMAAGQEDMADFLEKN